MAALTSMPEAKRVAAAIRLYLDRHPQAADTAEGIQRWWLLPQIGEVSLSVVEAALTQLEQEGTVRMMRHTWSSAAPQRPAPQPPGWH